MGYRHHGKNIYIGYDGKIVKMNMWRRFLDSMRGRFNYGQKDNSLTEFMTMIFQDTLKD